MHKWRTKEEPRCDCKVETMHHVVGKCEHRRFTRTLEDLHSASDEAVQWLDKLDLDILTKEQISDTLLSII